MMVIFDSFFMQAAQKFGVGSFGVGLIIGSSSLCVVVLSPVLGYFVSPV